jgi:hypothetical protein
MISGMKCRKRNALITMCVIGLAGSPRETALLAAESATELSVANQSTPELRIRVYGFPGLSAGVLHEAYTEAARLLRPVSIELKWVDCTSPARSLACTSPPNDDDLALRVCAKALPSASARALGMTAWSGDDAAVLIFFDRANRATNSHATTALNNWAGNGPRNRSCAAAAPKAFRSRIDKRTVECRRSDHDECGMPGTVGTVGAIHAKRGPSQNAQRTQPSGEVIGEAADKSGV